MSSGELLLADDDCLELPELNALAEGRLDDAARDLALAHIERCEACRELLAALCADEPASAIPPIAGATLDARYTVLEPLGSGGWGDVWSAFDQRLRRRVAVKLLRAERLVNPDDRFRIAREAETLARLRHPAIVTVHDSGDLGGRPYLVMDLVDGAPLPVYLARTRPGIARIVELFRHAGEGLAAAHRAAIVHRDFKPANLLVDATGEVRVTDFGLAIRAVPETDPSSSCSDRDAVADMSLLDVRLTPTRGILGTPGYMAPELLRGEIATPASDQFAFCAGFAEAITGAPLLTLDDVRAGGIPPDALTERLRGVPRRLRPVLARGLDPDRARRYADLPALLGDVRKRERRRRLGWLGLVLASAAVMLAVAGHVVRARRIAECIPTATPFAEEDAAAEAVDPMDELRRTLQSYQRERLTAYADLCRATHGRPLDAPARSRAQFFCLEQARVEEEGIGHALERGAGVTRGLHLISRLPSVTACGELDPHEVSAYDQSGAEGTQRWMRFVELVAAERLQDTRVELEALLQPGETQTGFAADVFVAIGAQAANRREDEQAVAYFERGLAAGIAAANRRATMVALLGLVPLAEDDPARAELLLALAEPLADTIDARAQFLLARANDGVVRGRFDAALADIDALLAESSSDASLVEALRREREVTRALSVKAKVQMHQGNHAAALRTARTVAQAQLELSGHDLAHALALAQLGGYAERARHYDEAAAVLDAAARAFARQDNTRLELKARVQQARQLTWSMRWDEAVALLRAAEESARTLGLDSSLAQATSFRAFVHRVRGETSAAAQACEAARAASVAAYGVSHVRTLENEAFCVDGWHATEAEEARLASVVEHLQRTLETATTLDRRTARGALIRARSELARIAVRRGDPREVERHARAALAERDAADPGADRTVDLLLAEALARAGDSDAALPLLDLAVSAARGDLARGRIAPFELGDQLAAAARVAAALPGADDRARALRLEAVGYFAAANLPRRVAQAGSSLARR